MAKNQTSQKAGNKKSTAVGGQSSGGQQQGSDLGIKEILQKFESNDMPKVLIEDVKALAKQFSAAKEHLQSISQDFKGFFGGKPWYIGGALAAVAGVAAYLAYLRTDEGGESSAH
jgi:hypothetical protein